MQQRAALTLPHSGSLIGSPSTIAELLQVAKDKNIKPWIKKYSMKDANQAVVDMHAGKARVCALRSEVAASPLALTTSPCSIVLSLSMSTTAAPCKATLAYMPQSKPWSASRHGRSHASRRTTPSLASRHDPFMQALCHTSAILMTVVCPQASLPLLVSGRASCLIRPLLERPAPSSTRPDGGVVPDSLDAAWGGNADRPSDRQRMQMHAAAPSSCSRCSFHLTCSASRASTSSPPNSGLCYSLGPTATLSLTVQLAYTLSYTS